MEKKQDKKIETKKLSLNKETIRVLENADLQKAAGGISGSYCGNETCWQDCGTRWC